MSVSDQPSSGEMRHSSFLNVSLYLEIQQNSEDISLEEDAVVDLYLTRVISEVLKLSDMETEVETLWFQPEQHLNSSSFCLATCPVRHTDVLMGFLGKHVAKSEDFLKDWIIFIQFKACSMSLSKRSNIRIYFFDTRLCIFFRSGWCLALQGFSKERGEMYILLLVKCSLLNYFNVNVYEIDDTVMQWLAPSPHIKKILGLNSLFSLCQHGFPLEDMWIRSTVYIK